MDKPRVIFVNRVYRPSTEATAQLLTDLAEGLAAKGWSVHVIADGTETGPIDGVQIHRTGRADKHGGLVSRTANYLGFLRAAKRAIGSLAKSGDIVVLMTDPPLLAAYATGIARQRGARVVHWVQDIYPEIVTRHIGAWAGWPLAPLKWVRNRAWRDSAICLPVGDDMLSTITSQGMRSDQVMVMPNWAPRELDQIPTCGMIDEYRAQQSLPAGFVVGYSGNLGRVHEFATVLEAARLLRDAPSAQCCTFRITGAGPQLPAVVAAKTKHQLDRLLIAPPVARAELALSLAACNAHLVSLKPGFESLVNPSKLTGILAASRPVVFVGPPRSALAAFIRDEGIGAVFAPGESENLATLLRRWVADNGAEAAAMGRRARTCYERRFTFKAALTNWEELLHAVLSSQSQTGVALPRIGGLLD